jgi:hypothetical protein
MGRIPSIKLVLALALALAALLLTLPQSGMAQPAGPGAASAGLQSPVVGPLIPVSTDGPSNYDPAVAYNSRHDEYLVVWSTSIDAFTHNIWAQRVAGDGSLRGGFNVTSHAGELLEMPAVAYSPAQDQYLIVYTNWYAGSGADVLARRVSWNGGWMSSEITITDAVDDQVSPAVAYNALDDEYLVVYTNQWAGGLLDVYAQRVRASDGTLLSWSAVASGGEGDRAAPAVAYSAAADGGNGGYLIAYVLHNTTTDEIEIRSKMTRADLSDLRPNPEVAICPNGNTQTHLAVAAGLDEVLAVWWEIRPEGYQLRGRRVSSSGTPLGGSDGFGVSAVYMSTGWYDPDVAYAEGYGYLATWDYDTVGPTIYDVHGRYVMAGQNAASGSPFSVDSSTPVQIQPGVACAPAGDCLVAYAWWNSTNYDIGGRLVRPHHVYLPLALRDD